ncbi:MAG: hypothetical protein GY809_19795, partial [Planctomycetes bacterium]|nr:hypothetical protein [Planctomycetota bacterium]
VLELKEHARLLGDDLDTQCQSVLFAAERAVEEKLERSLQLQTRAAIFSAWRYEFNLYRGTNKIDAFQYFLRDDPATGIDVDTADFYLDEAMGILRYSGVCIPDTAKIQIEYTSGGDGSDVSEDIRHALKMLASTWLEQTEGVMPWAASREMPLGVAYILMPHQRVNV